MRHRKAGRALGRNSSHRRALYRALVTSVLEHERIETTLPKAKEIRTFVDKMITLGKRGDLASRRRALAFIQKESVVRTLFSDIGPRFANRAGGYTRVLQSRRRLGDGAPMAVIELTELKPKATTAGPEKKGKGAKNVRSKEKPEAAAKAKAG
jgi:large subunit ribosomal protein L17